MKKIVGITGTTCVGKSAVAVELAKILQTEIVSADSMQIYKGMDIGTAKMTTEEMCGIRHHLLDVVLPCADFSSFEYGKLAAAIIDQMQTVPIVVGGTGFYFDSLVYPPEFGAGDQLRRQELKRRLDECGLAALQEDLRKLDCESYHAIDLRNPVRVMRAIEIAESGGKRSAGVGKANPQYDLQLYVLQRDRAGLYELINERVDKMIENGLVDEVCRLITEYGNCNTSAFSAIGYKEIIEYINGEISLEEAIEKIKINTRHYAKRQQTYFRKMNVRKFIDVEGLTPVQIAESIAADLQL